MGQIQQKRPEGDGKNEGGAKGFTDLTDLIPDITKINNKLARSSREIKKDISRAERQANERQERDSFCGCG